VLFPAPPLRDAKIHLLNWDVVESDRLVRAHAHLKAVTSLSRQSWAAILRESDDENEWTPSPRQTNRFPGLPALLPRTTTQPNPRREPTDGRLVDAIPRHNQSDDRLGEKLVEGGLFVPGKAPAAHRKGMPG
jgi:hypothetical protein